MISATGFIPVASLKVYTIGVVQQSSLLVNSSNSIKGSEAPGEAGTT